ncbi:MAG TPA: hypothetical protein VGG00_03950 [Rhodanobacter sp.]
MNVFDQLARVQMAQMRMSAARQDVSTPAAALLTRSHQHPLTTVGMAAGTGFVLGSLNVHPLRVPGLGSLVGGGMAELVAHGTRLLAEVGMAGFEAAGRHTDDDGQDAAAGESP